MPARAILGLLPAICSLTAARRVVGRARASNAWHMPEFDSIDETFSGEALPFKAALTTEARPLVRDCLVQLGLISVP